MLSPRSTLVAVSFGLAFAASVDAQAAADSLGKEITLARAEASVKAVVAEARSRAKQWKDLEDAHPRQFGISYVADPYGLEPLRYPLRTALSDKSLYWASALELFEARSRTLEAEVQKERERIEQGASKAPDAVSSEAAERIAAQARLQSAIRVAKAVIDDIKADVQFVDAYGAEAGTVESRERLYKALCLRKRSLYRALSPAKPKSPGSP